MNLFKNKTNSQLERKIKNPEHNLGYVKKVYPRNKKKINRLRCQIYYFRKKIENL